MLAVLFFGLCTLHVRADHGFPASTTNLQFTIKTNFYLLSGNSLAALRPQLLRLGPWTPEGRKVDAYTSWKMNWGHGYGGTTNGYFIVAPSVVLDLNFTFPRWIAPTNTSAADFAEWRRYMGALMTHELGHVAIATRHAEQLLKLLGTNFVFHSGRELRQYVESQGQRCINETRLENLKYDRQTEHGTTQGARLR